MGLVLVERKWTGWCARDQVYLKEKKDLLHGKADGWLGIYVTMSSNEPVFKANWDNTPLGRVKVGKDLREEESRYIKSCARISTKCTNFKPLFFLPSPLSALFN